MLGAGFEEESSEPLSTSAMDISFITTKPDGVDVDLQTVLKQIHGLSVHIWSSPQRFLCFKQIVKGVQLKQYEKQIHCLILDVETQWNSNFDMFKQVVQLKQSCVQYYKYNIKAKQLSLNQEE